MKVITKDDYKVFRELVPSIIKELQIGNFNFKIRSVKHKILDIFKCQYIELTFLFENDEIVLHNADDDSDLFAASISNEKNEIIILDIDAILHIFITLNTNNSLLH